MNSEISILITGATGFIGSAVARSLIQRDEFYVRGVARHFSAVLPKKIELAVHDLTRNTDWEGTLKGVEVVVHSAARVHVMKEVASDPLAEFRSVNVDATLNLARQAAAAGVRRFIFLSTIKVNGEATVRGERFHPDGPSTPQDPYAVSKHEAEIKLFKLSAETGLEVVVVRPPLVYGPGVKGNFATMVRWIKKGVPLPLGAIDNRRSLVALDNLVSFIALCADRRISPLAANQIFIVSDDEDESTPNLLRKVARAYGASARIVSMPTTLLKLGARILGKAAAADRILGSLQVDGSKARNLLGWWPVVTMDEQLRKMAEHDANKFGSIE